MLFNFLACPPNMAVFGDRCYYKSRITATYQEAEEFCRHHKWIERGYVAMPKTAQINNFLQDLWLS